MYRDRDRDARFHGLMTAWATLHDQEQPARFLMRHMSNTHVLILHIIPSLME
jgi:hypothetical protein